MRPFLRTLFHNHLFFYSLLIINFFGTLYGFYWYYPQFAETPVYLWLFVPNSPITVMYFFIVLVLILYKKRSAFWEGLAYFGLIKHGLWTVVIITLYELSGRSDPENFMLWFGHGCMALQAILFWTYFGLPLRFSQAMGISAWYVLNDYLDYVVGIHPRVDASVVSIPTIRALALSYTLVLTIIYLYTAWRHSKRKEHS